MDKINDINRDLESLPFIPLPRDRTRALDYRLYKKIDLIRKGISPWKSLFFRLKIREIRQIPRPIVQSGYGKLPFITVRMQIGIRLKYPDLPDDLF